MMQPQNKGAARFYQLLKVHKSYPEGSLPPGRPIISGNDSLTENLSKFVDFHTKPLVNKIASHIQDTPDFLRILDTTNKNNEICDTDILVTIDVVGLYTNIDQNEGIQKMTSALERREDKTIPTNFLIKLLNLVLKGNIFEFNNQLYLQLIGTAMGSAMAPSYATLFMEDIDLKVKNLAREINITDTLSNFSNDS